MSYYVTICCMLLPHTSNSFKSMPPPTLKNAARPAHVWLSDISRLSAGLSVVFAYGVHHHNLTFTRSATAFFRTQRAPQGVMDMLNDIRSRGLSPLSTPQSTSQQSQQQAAPQTPPSEPTQSNVDVNKTEHSAPRESASTTSSTLNATASSTEAQPKTSTPTSYSTPTSTSSTSEPAVAKAAATNTNAPVQPKVFNEAAVPSHPISRAMRFAVLGTRLAIGTAAEKIRRRLKFGSTVEPKPETPINSVSTQSTPTTTPVSSVAPNPLPKPQSPSTLHQQPVSTQSKSHAAFFTPGNADILASSLSRLRGAALKLGQMLSIQDQELVPAEFTQILERVRASADVMPRRQLEQVLSEDLGADWRSKYSSFDFAPFAAASIGQVHRAALLDGTQVVVKIQYPGVATSIQSDLENLRLLVKTFNVFPEGLYIDSILNFAKGELTQEVDYRNEAKHQTNVRELLRRSTEEASTEKSSAFKLFSGLYVPKVIHELCTARVLTQEFVNGVPIDRLTEFPEQIRLSVGERMMFLALNELFAWRYMQTDPNWGNFLYDAQRDRICLLDFGACREYSKAFVDDYMMLLHACFNKDQEQIWNYSKKLGFVTGSESKRMKEAHMKAALALGQPFQGTTYDFSRSDVTSVVSKQSEIMLKERLTSPPLEAYTIHRKFAGNFVTSVKLGLKDAPIRHHFYRASGLKEPPLPL